MVVLSVPLWFQFVLAQMFAWLMKVPLVAKAQVRILSAGFVEPAMP
jgi:hypothetical protein